MNEPNVTKDSINYFKKTSGGGRGENDIANKVRENAIVMMLNKEIPEEFLLHDTYWCVVADRLHNCIDKMIASSDIDLETNSNITYIKAAGRGKHHDFEAIGNDGTMLLKIEFKNGATKISETPQFVSPMKPSQYMTESFESFFYDTGLPSIVGTDFSIPDKDEWMSQVHGTKPDCMKSCQAKYYSGCKASSRFTGNCDDIMFYEKCKLNSDKKIVEFLSKDNVSLCSDILSSYFIKTQEKTYLMFNNGEFTHQFVDPLEFKIKTVKKEPTKQRFVVTTESGRLLKILLRWKNGNSIAFPAFQISLVDR